MMQRLCVDEIARVEVLIDCLRDLGHEKSSIDDRIKQWMTGRKLSGPWREMSQKQLIALAQIMKLKFEREYQQRNAR
jgi:hypothetical protein